MWFKWAGAVLIVLATSLWGNQQAAKMRRRVRQLEEFRLALRLLMAEIGYTATPLPRALEYVQGCLGDERVKQFFAEIVLQLGRPEVGDASQAWLRAVEVCRGQLSLRADDWPLIIRAAAGLGGLGRESQLKQLEAAESQLAGHTARVAENCVRSERMWRYLGVLGGAALVIVLL
ncbi:MAG: stage III sporulation protein AB [Dethiobacter sp.]|jgi:stage III sporulation protein AB|nr:stage III sporulation protein AB [Dethiobacter sp.]MBS3898156.1 stage III sporulation protein AB [Dethiobacter sp.]MBS3982573.1 stage III sporulation protein AB [Dethiobacter sp.]MCL4464063.1 stage III sporulation protein AB [Bacillota bacterium]MCL5993078.1 stage III sporulation protein AB [Bacillota bacterium]